MRTAMLGLMALAADASAADVVVFGDSWAEGSADELADVFVARGRPDITVAGYGVGGTTADFWAQTPRTLPDMVALNPDARWVWLSIGGNDLFGNYAAGQGAQNAALYDEDLRVVLDALFARYPDIQVVMFGYDYVNFEQSAECQLMGLTYFGLVTTFDVNGYFLADVHGTQIALQADYPNLTHVHEVLGTLQRAGGVAGAPNPIFPSPSGFMSDCIHPNSEGYRRIHEALYDHYWGLPEPVPVIGGGTRFCQGDVGVFTAPGVGASSWSVDGVPVGEGSPLELQMTVVGAHQLELVQQSGAWVASDELAFEVVDAPASVSIDGPEAVEVGRSSTYALFGGGSGSAEWALDGGGRIEDGGASATVVWESAGTWTLSAVWTPDEGCPGEAVRTVVVREKPTDPTDGSDVTLVEREEAKEGCGCATGGSAVGWLPVGLLLVLRRRADGRGAQVRVE